VYYEALIKWRLGKVPVKEVITKFGWRRNLSGVNHRPRVDKDSQVVCRPI
jgi:hypothetical protein